MNPVKISLSSLALLASLVPLSASVFALPSDKAETIRGSADNLTVDQKSGIATYTGSVEIRQGSLLINADSIIVHTNSEGGVEKMIARGKPAKFQQQPDEDQGVVTAAAQQITYTPKDERLLLVEDASVEQNGAVMSGPQIDYDLLKEVMKAEGSNSGQGQRIEIVIPPRNTKPVPPQPTTADDN